ncbi:MAG: NCS2 family permease [Cetobacterium sp.]|uniref:NCS2 family permease n=1 Tax=unclassified Cetobacterium TaxID=2630983 RepID=UPI00163BFED2|nr:NCS2 family permease [Cetobacterium sp. 2A]MBC2855143.1 NCS2 family permease [Cetobacterium sp. 2A]
MENITINNNGFLSYVDRYFKLSENNSSISTEITAGITTFMTMAYILIVQPIFMGAAGMDTGAVTIVTAILSAIFSIIMGLYTNRPFAMAPAMGGNAFFAYTLVAGGMVTWEIGIGMVFLSGIGFLILTLFGLREIIVKAIPRNLKFAIGVAVGFFIAMVGFKNGNLMTIVNGTIQMGSLKDPVTFLSLTGLVITIALVLNKVKGGVLIGILTTTILGIPFGITNIPSSFFSMPPSIMPIAFKLDILGALKLAFFPLIFTFFVGDFFSTLGTLLGVSSKANLLDENGNLPEIDKPFLVDSIATILGAVIGSTTITTFLESAAGVEEGGRTGLTAVTTGICFLLTIFITPIVYIIPSAATAPALIFIGILMMTSIKFIDMEDLTEFVPAAITIMFTIFTDNMATGMSIGILSHIVVKIVTGKAKDLNLPILILSIPLLGYFIFL